MEFFLIIITHIKRLIFSLVPNNILCLRGSCGSMCCEPDAIEFYEELLVITPS